jgi:hypothetical protein
LQQPWLVFLRNGTSALNDLKLEIQSFAVSSVKLNSIGTDKRKNNKYVKLLFFPEDLAGGVDSVKFYGMVSLEQVTHESDVGH